MIPRLLLLIPLVCSSLEAVDARPLVDAGAPFGELPLLDEIRCDEAGGHEFEELPKGASAVETILGKPCRVMAPAAGAKTFAYRIGKGKGLTAGAAYVLSIEYPEDKPRTLYLINRGAETMRGVATGSALGDVLYSYTGSNPESLKYPLAQQQRTWKALFRLHDRTAGRDGSERTNLPEDGFWVLVSQPERLKDPGSEGAAVASIRLFAVPEPAKFDLAVNYPPTGLPRRHLFWREEMADGVIDNKDPAKRGVSERVQWFGYKAELMKFLGMNTFSKDLLEFGHNQGWDSAPHGGNDWVYQSSHPELWRQTVETIGKHGFDIMPYYEYSGSVGGHGLGNQKRARPLKNPKDYTHVEWCERNNADITDPETLADFCKILDVTIVRNLDAAKFTGAWIRPRPSALPIGFADATLARFTAAANGGSETTRELLIADAALRERYYRWWYVKRGEFLIGVRDYLRGKGLPEAAVLFTSFASEEGPSVDGNLVTDETGRWRTLLQEPGHKGIRTADYAYTVSSGRYLESMLTMHGTWGDWEWQHAVPPPNPEAFTNADGVYMTYPFNKTYTVSSSATFDAFRSKDGLAMIRHYALNEHSIPKDQVGYFVADVERPGPYSMLSEVRAMAYGDPRYIGYLASNSFTRGFPEYARAFNAAYLALPALPSVMAPKASADAEVVVRTIATPKDGTYLVVANTGFADKAAVKLTLPVAGTVIDAVTGTTLGKGTSLTLPLRACELRSLCVK